MAVPSTIFFAGCLLFVAVGVLLLLRHYLPLRSTPEYLLLSAFLGLFISSSIVVLLPIDLASSTGTDGDSRGIVLPIRAILVCWRIAYWLCFVLTWAILPILQSYSDSGHRSAQKRFLQALRENARYHLIVCSIGVVGLVYFFITSGFHIYTLKSLLVALSYCYALVLAIYLMGHGLVAVPRDLFKNASASGKLRRLQKKAVKAYDKLLESTANLEEVEIEVSHLRQRKSGSAKEFQEWIDELNEMAQLPEAALARAGGNGRNTVPPVITEEYLATLTARLKLCIHRRARFLSEWEHLVQSAADCQSIINSSTSKRLTFQSHFSSPSLIARIPFLNQYTRHILHLHVLPHLKRLLAVFLALASAFIVWSELVHTAFPKLSIVGYTVVHHPSSTEGKIGFAGQVIAAAWIAYMCICAYFSLSVVKVWGSYALVKRMTAGSSACFYASYAARLTIPLAYNFLTFLPNDIVKDTVYHGFLGKLIELTALGGGFDAFFPMFILLPVAAAGFNLYGRIKNTFGFGGIEDEDEEENGFAAGGWREGRDLIERELQGVSSGGFTRGPAATATAGRAPVRPVGRSDPPASRSTTAGTTRSTPAQRPAPLPPPMSPPQRERYRDNPDEEGDEDENPFVAFTHRMRNTFEELETPRWMQDLRDAPKPKWLGGDG